nr:mucin-4-like isoform X2 [Dermacentor andersoni]
MGFKCNTTTTCLCAEACSSVPEQVGGEEAAAAPVVLSPAGYEKGSHQVSCERPRKGRICPSSIDPGGDASHSPNQGKLAVEANNAVDPCRKSRLRQQRPSPPSPAKKGRTKPAEAGEQKQSCQPESKFKSIQSECSMHDMVQRIVQSPRKGAVAPVVSPPPVEERQEQRYPSRRKREQSASEEMVTALQSECTVAIINDKKELCDAEICQTTPADHQDRTAEKCKFVREKHAWIENQSPGLKTAPRNTRKKNKRSSSAPMALSKDTIAESSPVDPSQQTLLQHSSGPALSNFEKTSNPIQCSVVEGSENRGKPLRMLITRAGTTKSVISCNRVNMRCEPLPENAAACHLNTSSTQVPCNVLSSELALQSSTLKDRQPDTKDTQSSSHLLEAQVGDDLYETLNKLHITEADSRKKVMETDSEKECLSSVHCDTIPGCETSESNAPTLEEQDCNDECLNKDTDMGNYNTNIEENTSSEKKSLQPAAAIMQDVEQKALEEHLSASTFPAGHNATSTSSMMAGTSSSPTTTRPSARRPLTLAEMTSAVESILQTTEQTLAMSEQCHDMLETDANLIDKKEVDSATDSLLKEMSVNNEDINFQLITSCMPAQQDKTIECATPTTLHKNEIPSDDKRDCGGKEIRVKSTPESLNYMKLSQRELAMFETQISISQNEDLTCSNIPCRDELSGTRVPSEALLTKGKVLDPGAQLNTPNSSPQCFDAIGLNSVIKETKSSTTSESGTHQQKISEQSTFTESSTTLPTECLEDIDTKRSYEGTRLTCTLTEASKHDGTRKKLNNSESSQIFNAEISVQVPEIDQNVKIEHEAVEMGDKNSLLESAFNQTTFQPLLETQAKQDDGQKALTRPQSSNCLHFACEDNNAPHSLVYVPPLETALKQSAGVELFSNLSLTILQETHNTHANITEKGSCSVDNASKSAEALETPAQEVELSREQPTRITEVSTSSHGSDNATTITSPCSPLYNIKPGEGREMDTSSFVPELLSLNSDEQSTLIHADQCKQLDHHHASEDHKLSNMSVDADTPAMLSPSKNAAIKVDNRCFSYLPEEQSTTGSGSNEHLQNERTNTKALPGALLRVPSKEEKPGDETSIDSLKLQESTENTMLEIIEKAAVVTRIAECTFSNVGTTGEPSDRKKDVLHFPQDEDRQREMPEEITLQHHATSSPLDKSRDKDAMSTYITNQDVSLTSCELPKLQDKCISEALNRETGVNLDNSNDAMNASVSDSAITSSMPLILVVSESSSGCLANMHKQKEKAQAVGTISCSLGAGFTVTQQQHYHHPQDASGSGSCDSTTEPCNALQHSTAVSVKKWLGICPDANSVTSVSEKGQHYDETVQAPDSTNIECNVLLRTGFCHNSANVMVPVQAYSSPSIQDTKELPSNIIPCSNALKLTAISQFSPVHENDVDIPNKPMQGDAQMQTTQDRRAAPEKATNMVRSVSGGGETRDNIGTMKSESTVGGAHGNFSPVQRTLENKDNFDYTSVSCVCSEEGNLASTGEQFATATEVKEDIKDAASELKQRAITICEVSPELKNTKRTEVTDSMHMDSPSEILSQKHECVEGTRETMAGVTKVIMVHSNKDNTTATEQLLEDENNSLKKCTTDNDENKLGMGGSPHLHGISPEHPPSTMSVAIPCMVHEANALSQYFPQESTNILVPEHSEELHIDVRREREARKEFESAEFGGLEELCTKELIDDSNDLNVTGSTNTSVKARQTIPQGAETNCVPHSSTLRKNDSAHSNLSSIEKCLEDGIRPQDVETVPISRNTANMERGKTEQTNVKGIENSSSSYSLKKTCFTGLYSTLGPENWQPEPSNTEYTTTPSVHIGKDDSRTTELNYTHTSTDMTRGTACSGNTTGVEYSIAAHAVSQIPATECINLAQLDVSDSDETVERHTPTTLERDSPTNAEHSNTSVETVNSSVNFTVRDDLLIECTAGNRQHCALLPAEDVAKGSEIQGKEYILSSPSNSTSGNVSSLIYNSKGTKKDSIQMEAQHGADLLRASGADGVDIDVATMRSMEFPSRSESQKKNAVSNTCGGDTFNIFASPKSSVERRFTGGCNNPEAQPREAYDPFRQNCGKSHASAGLQHETRETKRNVLDRGDPSDSSGGTSCSESEEHEMARLRGRGVRKQVAARAAKESSEASSDGEGSEAGNRRLRNGRRATPEEPRVMRRSSRNRKAATEGSPKEDSDAATEPESTPGSPQLEEGQVLSPVHEEEEQPVGRCQEPSEEPRSPPNSEPPQEEGVKSQEERAEVVTAEPDQRPPQEERPAKEHIPEDVEMKDDDESQPAASEASPPKFKTRRISTAALKKDSEDKEERPQRKRRWGSTNVVLGPSVSISTAALKDLIPDIEEPLSKPKELEEEHVTASVGESPVAELEETSDEPPVKLQVVDDEATSEEVPPCNDKTENKETREDGEPSHSEKSAKGEKVSRDEKPKDDRLPRSERIPRDEKEKPLGREEKAVKADQPPREVSRDDKLGRHDANTKEMKVARERASPITAPSAERKALRVISDRAPLSKRPAASKDEVGQRKLASPPRNPKSRILFVRNLVRPFTLNQLKQLLQEFGDTVDSEFWIDKIKSKCFVTYVSEEDAVKAREALHNLRWPLCNPKILHVDFSSLEEVHSLCRLIT